MQIISRVVPMREKMVLLGDVRFFGAVGGVIVYVVMIRSLFARSTRGVRHHCNRDDQSHGKLENVPRFFPRFLDISQHKFPGDCRPCILPAGIVMIFGYGNDVPARARGGRPSGTWPL